MNHLSDFESDADTTLQGFRRWWRSLRPLVKAGVVLAAVVVVLVVWSLVS